MAQYYAAWIDDKSTRLLTFEQLKDLALSRNLPNETPVRLEGESEWRTWGEIPALQMAAGAARAHLSRPLDGHTSPAVVQRDVVRDTTAYPFLRKFGDVLVWVSVGVMAVLWIIVICQPPDSHIWPYVIVALAGSLSVPVTIFINGAVQALVDIADKTIQRD